MERTVKTYGDIIARIEEIIRKSAQKEKELDPQELKDNYNNYFAHILYCNIANDLANEFRECIDAERTFMMFKKSSPFNCLDKTRDLLEICKENSIPQNNNCFYYQEIAQIISESYGKTAFELTAYKGYYILREKLDRWLWLMRKVNLLPNDKKMSESERKAEVDQIFKETQEQYNRLKEYIERAKNQELTSVTNNTSNFNIDLKSKKHQDLIFLGIHGSLSIKTIEKLRFSYSEDQYQLLLDELLEWQIFSPEEIENLRKADIKTTVITDDLEELLSFFATKKNLNANALRALKPAIGDANLIYLINTLYRVGSISTESYEEYLTLETGVDTKIMKGI